MLFRKKNKSGARGVTLIELMIAVAIVGVLINVGSNLYIQVRRFFFLSNTRVELQRDARSVMEVVTKQLRQALSSTIVIDQVAGEPYYSRISFTTIDNRTFKFYQNGTNLYVVEGSTRALTSDLSSLSFALPRSDDMGIVSVTFTLEKSIYDGQTKALHMASEKVRVMN